MRATPQVTALTSDTASSQETQRSDLAMLSLGHLSSWILSPVPCLTFLKSVVHNWAKPLKYKKTLLSVPCGYFKVEGRIGAKQHLQ